MLPLHHRDPNITEFFGFSSVAIFVLEISHRNGMCVNHCCHFIISVTTSSPVIFVVNLLAATV